MLAAETNISYFSGGRRDGGRPSGHTFTVQFEHINLHFDSGSLSINMDRHQRGQRTKGGTFAPILPLASDMVMQVVYVSSLAIFTIGSITVATSKNISA